MKYLILGAGPAGLSFANRLLQSGQDSFLVLEAENEAGGLCRSCMVDGSEFDIGGGHFLDVRRPKVNEFLFGFMPKEEWNLFERDSRIVVKGQTIHHPMEANIWEMDTALQVEYLKSIAVAGCNLGKEMPSEFVDWIYWKLGGRIAEDYMIPYNQKMFSRNLNELGTYWLEKLPNVSFEETLLSCLNRKAYGTQPGHAQFYYPKKYGYGELWRRMGAALGEHLLCGRTVAEIDYDSKTVKTVDGASYQADSIITTIPWTAVAHHRNMPDSLAEDIARLKYSSIETRYYGETLDTKAQWIYYPDPALSYHRILVRSNFCTDSKGYWTETNTERADMLPEADKNRFAHVNRYAYPLNTITKPAIMERLLAWAKERNVYGLGRWGEWSHYNSDLTVELAMHLADRLEER